MKLEQEIVELLTKPDAQERYFVEIRVVGSKQKSEATTELCASIPPREILHHLLTVVEEMNEPKLELPTRVRSLDDEFSS